MLLPHSLDYLELLSLAAGLRSVAVAENTVTVDRTPPLISAVNDGSVVSLDASFQSSLNELCVNWKGISDPESGVAEIEWRVSKWLLFLSILITLLSTVP